MQPIAWGATMFALIFLIASLAVGFDALLILVPLLGFGVLIFASGIAFISAMQRRRHVVLHAIHVIGLQLGMIAGIWYIIR